MSYAIDQLVKHRIVWDRLKKRENKERVLACLQELFEDQRPRLSESDILRGESILASLEENTRKTKKSRSCKAGSGVR